jgi:Domain of unknown function (DUF4158)
MSKNHRELLADRRGDHNRLGLALQIVTARFLGTFLSDPTDVPAAVVASVAAQLGIPGNTDLAPYRDGEARWDHAALIRKLYGYRDFGEQPEHFKLIQAIPLAIPGMSRGGPFTRSRRTPKDQTTCPSGPRPPYQLWRSTGVVVSRPLYRFFVPLLLGTQIHARDDVRGRKAPR